ncbi:Uncharacterised protein [Legionella busanensis]|uniref:Uncharacterized protein n=1 Tax=Legionella busanensis TaxID=190655 RepID=A0A378JRQ2_9GAMM|nr:hypothetical protein [Legionella busanensis]STX52849.1 Uncharacterised protein [Legionella busanensis]
MPYNTSQLEKEREKKEALYYINLLIKLISEQAFFRLQELQKRPEEKEEEARTLEKNINHCLTLLASVKSKIKDQGPSSVTDYLITSAISHLANSLPPESVSNIVTQLNTVKINESKTHNISKQTDSSTTDTAKTHQSKTHNVSKQADSSPTDTAKISESKTHNVSKQANSSPTNPDFPRLLSTIRATFSHEISLKLPPKPLEKQVVIDFAADKPVYSDYGVKCAQRLGANLIQSQPDNFSAVNEKFSISEGTILTLIGHCSRGSNHLSDNSGRRIRAAEIAEQIYINMKTNNTPFETPFTIDLIACQAASSTAKRPAFAQLLVDELSKRGIKNAKVIASPTIMTTTPDGRQANLSREEDQKMSAQLQGVQQHEVNSCFKSGGTASFFKDTMRQLREPGLKVEKQTFTSKPS